MKLNYQFNFDALPFDLVLEPFDRNPHGFNFKHASAYRDTNDKWTYGESGKSPFALGGELIYITREESKELERRGMFSNGASTVVKIYDRHNNHTKIRYHDEAISVRSYDANNNQTDLIRKGYEFWLEMQTALLTGNKTPEELKRTLEEISCIRL